MVSNSNSLPSSPLHHYIDETLFRLAPWLKMGRAKEEREEHEPIWAQVMPWWPLSASAGWVFSGEPILYSLELFSQAMHLLLSEDALRPACRAPSLCHPIRALPCTHLTLCLAARPVKQEPLLLPELAPLRGPPLCPFTRALLSQMSALCPTTNVGLSSMLLPSEFKPTRVYSIWKEKRNKDKPQHLLLVKFQNVHTYTYMHMCVYTYI